MGRSEGSETGNLQAQVQEVWEGVVDGLGRAEGMPVVWVEAVGGGTEERAWAGAAEGVEDVRGG